jgi:hypothetical protein
LLSHRTGAVIEGGGVEFDGFASMIGALGVVCVITTDHITSVGFEQHDASPLSAIVSPGL